MVSYNLQVSMDSDKVKGEQMFRISINDLPDEQRWSLQGQLVGQWASELRSTWREARLVEDK
jgi:hypothetical protein